MNPSPREAHSATLPLFPLHTVLLPRVHLPLHIFEPRYRQLTVDLMNGTRPDRQFGVIAIRNTLVHEVEKLDQLHEIGCTATLRESRPLPDGRFDIITTGSRRFRLKALDTTAAPYLLGTVEWLPDDPLPGDSTDRVLAASLMARAAHQRYCQAAWDSGDWHTPDDATDPMALSYLLAEDCLLPMSDRQALLAETDPLRRLRMVTHLLGREAGFLGALRAVPASSPHLDDVSTPAKLN